MYTPKKTTKKLQRQFQRDIEFGFPFNKSRKNSPEHDAFVMQLYKNEDFVPTYTANYTKFADSLGTIIKKFNTFDYALMIVLTIACGFGTFTYGSEKYNILNAEKAQSYPYSRVVLFTILGALFGLFFGGSTSLFLRQATTDSARDNLYNRLSVRLFDSLRETYPDLDEGMLKHCNPEMARVIKALLMTNMPEKDTREILELSEKFAKTLHEITPKNETEKLLQCNEYLKTVMSIIEHNLITNQALNDAILAVYHGHVPLQFAIQNNQKIK